MVAWSDVLVREELLLRLGSFTAVFLAVTIVELLAPKRMLELSRASRWPNNLALVGLNALLIRLLFPAATVGTALWVEEQGLGLLAHVEIPGWASILIAIVVLDLTVYAQHVLVHAVPLFWRFHRVHHADLDMDVTTGSRFHPVEMVFSLWVKIAAVVAIGASPAAVVAFEVLLNATAMFNHGNLALPPWLDRVLRKVVVTPDMHRVHHSSDPRETSANYGFNLPWWDWIFSTYRAQPLQGHLGMEIGVRGFRDPSVCARLTGMLVLPLRGSSERPNAPPSAGQANPGRLR